MRIGLSVRVRAVVVPLDVIHVDGLGDAGVLVQLAQVARELRVVDDAAQVALEVADVHGVEAHERREQAPVRLGDRVAHQVAARREARVELVERVEEPAERALVGGLRAREAGAVDAVVDVLVDERVELVDLGAQLVGQEVEARGASRRRRTRCRACG